MEVEYKCPNCGHMNSDDTQLLNIHAQSDPTIFWLRKKHVEQVKSRSEAESERVLDKVRQNSFQDFTLTCRCEKCREFPVWARRPEYSKTGFTMFVFGITFIVLEILVLIFGKTRVDLFDFGRSFMFWVTPVVALLLSIPMIIYKIKLKKYLKRVSEIPEDEKPRMKVLHSDERDNTKTLF